MVKCLASSIEVSELEHPSTPSFHRSFVSVFQLAPGDDAMFSHTYSPLNRIVATNRFSGVDDMSDFIQGTDGKTGYATLHRGVHFEKTYGGREEVDCCEHDLICESVGGGV